MARCSLCDCELDSQRKKATVPTRGGWVAHEECVQSCESVRLLPGEDVGHPETFETFDLERA